MILSSPTAGRKAGSWPAEAKILIVDDRREKLLAYEAILSSLGQPIIGKQSGRDALRALLADDFAVILLDVNMPGMDGFETAQLIRQRPRSETTPIIFITSDSQNENYAAKGYALGAVDYISIPVMPEILRAKVGVFIDLYLKNEQLQRQAMQLGEIEARMLKDQLADAGMRLETQTRRNRFFTHAKDLLCIAEGDARILQVNSSFTEYLGTPGTGRPAGLAFPDLLAAEDRPAFLRALEALAGGIDSIVVESRILTEVRPVRRFEILLTPDRETGHLYIFARDITERQEAEASIRQLNAELDAKIRTLSEINSELDTFSYSVSHDLRAPLNTIQSFTELLLGTNEHQLDERGRDFARRIITATHRMQRLLSDLLAYSRLSRGQVELSTVRIDKALSEALIDHEKAIEERQARISTDIQAESAIAHPTMLSQALSNLLGNALKFVPADRHPEIKVASWNAENDSVVICVADNGIGISPEHHELIFKVFSRLAAATNNPGTGIGLSIVKRVVEKMQGTVRLTSIPGVGSQFFLELGRPACAAAAPCHPSLNGASAVGTTV